MSQLLFLTGILTEERLHTIRHMPETRQTKLLVVQRLVGMLCPVRVQPPNPTRAFLKKQVLNNNPPAPPLLGSRRGIVVSITLFSEFAGWCPFQSGRTGFEIGQAHRSEPPW